MNTFKNKAVYWGFMVLASMFAMVLGIRAAHNGTATNILYMYIIALPDIILLMLIIPIIFLIILYEIDGFMATNRLLAFNSRLKWWVTLRIKLLKDCFACAAIIILPIFLLSNIFIGTIKTFGEWIYILFLFLTYFMYFFLLALCIVTIEIKFNQSLLAVSFVLFISFLPNILSSLFRHLKIPIRIPSINSLLNLSYTFDEDNFCWLRCIGMCIVLFVLLFLAEKAGKMLFKKQDIYWK